MVKKLMTAFTIFSILILVFVVFWATYRTVRKRNVNVRAVTVSVERFERNLLTSYLTDGSFAGGNVADAVRTWLRSDDAVLAFVIHDSSTPEYVYSRTGEYLDFDASPADLDIEVPSFSYNALRERLVTGKIVFPDNTVRELNVLATVLTRRDIFPVVREVLIALLAFLLITATMIAVLPALSARERQAGAPLEGRRPTDSSVSGAPQGEPAVQTEDASSAEQADSATVSATQKQASDSAAVATSGADSLDPETTVHTPAAPQTASRRPGLYSPVSKLGWEEYLEERLNTELRRAASFDQDLVLIIFTKSGVYRDSAEYQEFADRVREYFTFRDLCFEFGPSGIGVIVPNIDLDQGIERCEDYHKDSSADDTARKLYVGISARNGRLIQGERLIREATRAAEKAKADDNPIIAFRVDPEKYRSYIVSRSHAS